MIAVLIGAEIGAAVAGLAIAVAVTVNAATASWGWLGLGGVIHWRKVPTFVLSLALAGALIGGIIGWL